jgi:hypothetical protein
MSPERATSPTIESCSNLPQKPSLKRQGPFPFFRLVYQSGFLGVRNLKKKARFGSSYYYRQKFRNSPREAQKLIANLILILASKPLFGGGVAPPI